jgi:hypothetical protein
VGLTENDRLAGYKVLDQVDRLLEMSEECFVILDTSCVIPQGGEPITARFQDRGKVRRTRSAYRSFFASVGNMYGSAPVSEDGSGASGEMPLAPSGVGGETSMVVGP